MSDADSDMARDNMESLAARIEELEELLSKRDEQISAMDASRTPTDMAPIDVKVELPTIGIDDDDVALSNAYRKTAKRLFGDESLEFDWDATVSITDEGAWVAAWRWVNAADVDEKDKL